MAGNTRPLGLIFINGHETIRTLPQGTGGMSDEHDFVRSGLNRRADD
jgi:hypothetical protein